MQLVELDDGGLLVYSPTRISRDVFEQIEAHGTPQILVAPNHYHHAALPAFREHYPDALVVAPRVAIPRLEKQGHIGLSTLDAARERLPEGVKLIECEGTRTGETWLEDRRGDAPELAVCDAFFNAQGPMRKTMGFALRVLRGAPGLCIGSTYRWLGLKDERGYHAWLRDYLSELAPAKVGFCHGVPIEGNDCSERLLELAERRLRR